MKAKIISFSLLIFALFGLLCGLAWLINLRFETGQAYPNGSSLRADPVGAKALFDAYDGLSEVSAQRNFTPFTEIKDLPVDAAILMLNVNGRSMYQLAQFESVERFVSSGGRLVVALNPNRVAYRYIEGEEQADEQEGEADLASGEAASVEDEAVEEEVRKPAFARRAKQNEKRFWGDLELLHGEHEGGDAHCLAVDEQPNLPLILPWREGGVLAELGEDWTAMYQIGEEVVAAQRVFGRGSIVLLTDDYLFSNEALLKHRYTGLLSWVLTGQRMVIFDETHLGVTEPAGVATLMRRYQLGGFCLGCAILLLLIIWRGVSPLLPAFVGRSKGNVILAENSTEAGLSDLVRRSVASVDLPREAFSQWQQSFIRSAADEAYYAQELQDVHALLAEYADLPKRKRKPAELHFNIQTTINRKKRRRL